MKVSYSEDPANQTVRYASMGSNLRIGRWRQSIVLLLCRGNGKLGQLAVVLLCRSRAACHMGRRSRISQQRVESIVEFLSCRVGVVPPITRRIFQPRFSNTC